MIGKDISHYKIVEKLGEPACQQAGVEPDRRLVHRSIGEGGSLFYLKENTL